MIHRTYPEQLLRARPQKLLYWPSSSYHRHLQEVTPVARIFLTPSLGPWHTEAPRSPPSCRGGCHTAGGRCWSLGTWTWSTAWSWTLLGWSRTQTGSGRSSLDIYNKNLINLKIKFFIFCFYPLLLSSRTELFLSLNAKQFLTLIPYLSVTRNEYYNEWYCKFHTWRSIHFCL